MYEVYKVEGQGSYSDGMVIVATNETDVEKIKRMAQLGTVHTYGIVYNWVEKLHGVKSETAGVLVRHEFGE